MEAAVVNGRAGVLRRAVYHDVASEEGKNFRDCVRRIDGIDTVCGELEGAVQTGVTGSGAGCRRAGRWESG